MSDKKKSYGDHIDQMIDETESLYDRSGSLRDWANEPEKDYWNALRGIYREASSKLRKLRHSLPKDRYNMT